MALAEPCPTSTGAAVALIVAVESGVMSVWAGAVAMEEDGMVLALREREVDGSC